MARRCAGLSMWEIVLFYYVYFIPNLDRSWSPHIVQSCWTHTRSVKLYLSYGRWVNKPHSRREVQKSKKLLGELITLIKLCFPRTDGNGWNIPKMHGLAKMPKNMLKSGANNFCGKIGEWALKSIVKDHAQQTQQRLDLFGQQCVLQEYETNLLRYVMSDIDGQLGLSTKTLYVSNNVVCPKEKFTLNMSTTNKLGVGVLSDNVMWDCTKRKRLKCGVSDLLTFALQRHSHINGYPDLYKVTDILRWQLTAEILRKRWFIMLLK